MLVGLQITDQATKRLLDPKTLSVVLEYLRLVVAISSIKKVVSV